MSFKVWLRQVDTIINRQIGCSLHDLEDYCWRDLYDEEYAPEEAAEVALEEIGPYIREGDPDFYDYMAVSDADPGL